MPFQLIFLIVILIGCIIAYCYFKRSPNKNKLQAGNAEKTAQEFINAAEVKENCLCTTSGDIFAFVQLEGVCLELFNESDLLCASRNLAANLTKIKYPWKYLAVSRPIDVKRTLQIYDELYQTSEGGKRQLLKHEMEELAGMASRGDTLERQHYIIVWGNDEKDTVKRAQELCNIFSQDKVIGTVLDRRGIVKLCTLVNLPAYAHLEDNSEQETVISALMKG